MQITELIDKSINTEFSSIAKHIGNLNTTSMAGLLAAVYQKEKAPLVIICEDNYLAQALRLNLKALLPHIPLYLFEDYETLPYDMLSPHQDIISNRLKVLSTIGNLREGVIITTVLAIMSRLPPVSYLKTHALVLKNNDKISQENFKRNLLSYGYLLVEQVLSPGELAVRGSILDVYPMGTKHPYRLDFFDDELDSIRTFDVDTQRTIEKVPSLEVLPAHEFPLDKEAISIFRSNYRDVFVGANLADHPVYQAISKGAVPSGIEYYLPLFFDSMDSFFDYLPENYRLLLTGNIQKAVSSYLDEANKRFKLYEGNREHPPLKVSTVFLTNEEFETKIKGKERIYLEQEPYLEGGLKQRGYYNTSFEKIPDIAFSAQDKSSQGRFLSFACSFLEEGGRILISATTEGRRQSLRELLPQSLTSKYGIKATSSFQHFLDDTAPLMLTIGPFDEGLIIKKAKLCFISENELLGYKVIRQKKRSLSRSLSEDTIIKNLATLKEGQVVVHIDHGIGRYQGLKTMEIGGVIGEYLTIEYQHGDMLNIPITALSKIARYSGAENPPLSRLGTDTWNKKKQKAVQKVSDVAAQLLDLYALREAHEGVGFEINHAALEEFSQGFGFQETPDQETAINNTLEDLQQKKPMDRLICGDVGFGKTEVALRAAFVVASNGYQVAILVPTTILAEQHYENFKDRFAGTAINVELLSRFKSVKQQHETMKAVSEGQIDIIIGTHKLLSKELKFKKLGLIIIDEEHRFGVKQKEKLKGLKAQVDILTLTATPIPRTLNMAMEGMRELSIIATPPEHRLAVKTFVEERTDSLVREAIMRELRRGGQVYYLHNDVATIEQRARQLEELVPEAKIGVGHGQLRERELQKIMRDFYQQRYNLLVCSTIIENGLDVPSANTIIIDRADKLGLAQLHQLRGRVGRSHHQAYAYLFTPPMHLLSKDARLRLEAISSLEELGAGFILATHDMEIRGVGELLGEEQSGEIEAVGFALYQDLLEHAVKALKSGQELSLSELTENDCDIDVHLPCLFPQDYIGNVNQRLSLYKKLSTLKSNEEFSDLKIELIDRFGMLPKSTENLFTVSKLKKLATDLGIKRIICDEKGGSIEFSQHHKVSHEYLISLMTTCKHNEYRLTGQNSLRYFISESEQRSRLKILEQLLMAFLGHSTLKDENQ